MTKSIDNEFDKVKYKKMLKTYTTKGETGVLSYNYSKKIIPLWKIKTLDLAKQSAKIIYALFLDNINRSERYLHFVDTNEISSRLVNLFMRADICRKFLLMGYTRAMRYYYHKTGKKWKYSTNTKNWYILPTEYDPEKKKSALIFKKYLDKALSNTIYNKLKRYFNDLPSDNKKADHI